MNQKKERNDEFFIRFQENDPEYQQQREQYGKAIPSRNFILELLTLHPQLNFNDISKRFRLRKVWEVDALENRLNAMIRAGAIYQDKEGHIKIVDLGKSIEGTVKGHAEGYGFLTPSNKEEEALFIPLHEMRYVLHGDLVEALNVGVDNRGRRIAKITKIISHNLTEFIGRAHREHGNCLVIPENRFVSQEFLVPEELSKKAKHLDIVRAKITQYPDSEHIPTAEILDVLGDTVTTDVEIEQALLEHDIPSVFSDTVIREVNMLPNSVSEMEAKGRKDYRPLPLVTIDGISARDFDDAVYCKAHDNGHYTLYVAIADVSHYVARESEIDKEAYQRGTSVYFPNRVIPMLHKNLSNGICSLNPNEDRLCMVCELEIDAQGETIAYQFFEGVIRSHARLTYDLVYQIVEGDELLRESYRTLTPHLDHLYTLYKRLRKHREKRGAIDFETTETLFLYNDDGSLEKIIPDERNEAHKIIEECMIAANIAAATFLEDHKIPTLYRVHNPPESKKLSQLRSFLKEFTLKLEGGEVPTPENFAQLIREAKKLDTFEMIQTVILRSLSQAVYQPENSGHFGLSLTHYAHFTSPIRRYPDLLVHRGIRHILQKSSHDHFYSEKNMMMLGEHTSMTERRADDAVRDVMDWLKAGYLKNFVGDQFEGHITGVTKFGLFVELKDIFVEGLVHISEIPGDYYHYDDVKHSLIGERTKQQYRLNGKVTIQVLSSSPETRHIDFALIHPVVASSRDSVGRKRPSAQKKSRHQNPSQDRYNKLSTGKKRSPKVSKENDKKRKKKSKPKKH